MAKSLLVAIILLGALAVLTGPVRAQVPVANPLLRPPMAPSRSDAQTPPSQAPARSAAERSPAPPPAGPAPAQRADSGDIPAAVLERVASLYVAAIVDGSAVLRSQVVVAQPGSGVSPGTGVGTGAGGGTGAPASPGAGTAGAGAGAQGAQLAAGSYRAASFVVHDSQPIRLFDNYRLLPRVDDEGVVLYLLPPRERRGETPRVVFRGLLSSVIGSPYVPARSALESPDGGLDGKARRELSNVDRRMGSGAGTAATSTGDGRLGAAGLGTGSSPATGSR